MKVLIITRLNKTAEEYEALEQAEAALKGRAEGAESVTVQRDEELDWPHLRQVEGSYGGAYRWASRHYDRIVVIEGPGQTMARGQTSIVEACLGAGTPVAAWRDGKGCRVRAVERCQGNDWKGAYAKAVV